MKLLKSIPWFLLYSRLAIAILFLLVGFFKVEIYTTNYGWFLFLFCFGFIGDIFDGMIARKLKMDTSMLRKLDSIFDTFFWLGSALLLYIGQPELQNAIMFGFCTVFGIDLMEYAVSLIRFGKTPSPHNTLSKFFGLSLSIYFVLAFANVGPAWLAYIVFSFGIVARLDALAIYLILKKWTHDIPSSYHAGLINKGIPFKRNKMFHSERK